MNKINILIYIFLGLIIYYIFQNSREGFIPSPYPRIIPIPTQCRNYNNVNNINFEKQNFTNLYTSRL